MVRRPPRSTLTDTLCPSTRASVLLAVQLAMAADGDARVDRAGQLQPGLLGDRLVDLQQILSQSREIERGEGQAVEAGLRLGNVDEGFEGAQDGLELGCRLLESLPVALDVVAVTLGRDRKSTRLNSSH